MKFLRDRKPEPNLLILLNPLEAEAAWYKFSLNKDAVVISGRLQILDAFDAMAGLNDAFSERMAVFSRMVASEPSILQQARNDAERMGMLRNQLLGEWREDLSPERVIPVPQEIRPDRTPAEPVVGRRVTIATINGHEYRLDDDGAVYTDNIRQDPARVIAVDMGDNDDTALMIARRAIERQVDPDPHPLAVADYTALEQRVIAHNLPEGLGVEIVQGRGIRPNQLIMRRGSDVPGQAEWVTIDIGGREPEER